MAVLSAAAVGGRCMTGDVDGDETASQLADSILAVSPTVSPSGTRSGPVDIDSALPGEGFNCPTFSFCPIVWAPLNQTSGTKTRFYDQNMNEVTNISPVTSPKSLTGIGWPPPCGSSRTAEHQLNAQRGLTPATGRDGAAPTSTQRTPADTADSR